MGQKPMGRSGRRRGAHGCSGSDATPTATTSSTSTRHRDGRAMPGNSPLPGQVTRSPAGLLACGSLRQPGLPEADKPQWPHSGRRSPLTVAGAAPELNRIPFSPSLAGRHQRPDSDTGIGAGSQRGCSPGHGTSAGRGSSNLTPRPQAFTHFARLTLSRSRERKGPAPVGRGKVRAPGIPHPDMPTRRRAPTRYAQTASPSPSRRWRAPPSPAERERG